MNLRLLCIVSLALLACLGLSGCKNCHKRPCCPPAAPCGPVGGQPLPVPAGPVTAPVPVPPPGPGAAVPAPPPNWTTNPPAPPGAVPPPGAPLAPRSNYSPNENAAQWQPADNSVRLVPPEPLAAEPAAPRAGVQENPAPAKEPSSKEPPLATPSLPVGIPQFALAIKEPQVATGLKPMLDGLDWLHSNGYKAVLHVRKPGEDDAADRKVIEKRGLKYLSLEVSPQTLNRDTLAEFNRLLADPSNVPLFVYDRDGALAGGLWYLHYRTIGKMSDEEARNRAGRLGLKPDGDGDARTMWLAIQKLLSEQ